MTDLLQRQASSPDRSVFVSANAGTGKTKILIERVLRLLLSGEVPETILCVTFTRAAAAEIQTRLHHKLASWAVAQPTDLIDDIKAMTGSLPSQSTIEVARRLFAQVIDNDQGPRIETTHSFCQSLLSRFPLEAGLPPQFELITDSQKDVMLRAGFASAFQEPHQEMKSALSLLIAISDHQTLFSHVKSFVSTRPLSDAAVAMPLGIVPSFEAALTGLIIDDIADERQAHHHFAHALSALPYHELADALPDKMAPFLSWVGQSSDEKATGLTELTSLFLTQKGTPKARFVPQKLQDSQPALQDIFERMAELMIRYHKALTAIATAERSRALYVVARHVAHYYEVTKLRQAVLDYDDLIIKANRLLSSSEAMAWVRWKLDFGIHHMLVDEAQDTNPAQWALLASLADEFFAHEADEANNRTLFSVGDFKQSIYSFQGANPHIFIEKGEEFAHKATQSHHQFDEVKLAMSFRSSKGVLDMVNHVMTGTDVQGLGGAYNPHEAHFKDKFGLVELWPIVAADKQDEPLPYFDVPAFLSDDEVADHGADAALAEKIACHIKTLLDGSAKGLNGRSYQPRDIMILVNKRNAIFALLRGALLRHNIPVTGADRMRLDQQIEIADLLALGDITILPEDDLQLAAFLKSPLIGLSEDALMHLAHKRKPHHSLITALKAYAGRTDAYGQAIATLEGYFALGAGLSPAAFYETILAQGGREAFYARLGAGIADSLNAFIDQAYEFEAKMGGNLADFLAHHRANDTEIKRDFGNIQENQVRILTIHGSKGLEAPVVYVPDIVKGQEPSETLITTDKAVYWPSDSIYLPDEIAQHKQADKTARADEHQRLLYVAMTRASECLFLAGYEKSRRSLKGVSWDVILEDGFKRAGISADDDGVYRYLYEGGQKDAVNDTKIAPDRPSLSVRQSYPWAFSAPAKEALPAKPLMPSAIAETDLPESLSLVEPMPLSEAQGGDSINQTSGKSFAKAQHPRLEGVFMHELLERLSQIAPDQRHQLAHYMAETSLLANSPAKSPIGAARLGTLADNMLAFMSEPEFAPLFGPDALSEFGISGVVGHHVVVGQIDKLVVTDDKLWLVDFKSGRPYKGEIPKNYLQQMALYAALLKQIYPKRTLIAEIIWLRDFSRTSLSDDKLEATLTSMGLK